VLALVESKQTDESIKTVSIKNTESTRSTRAFETTETFVAVETIEEALAFESQAVSSDRHIDFIPLRSGENADEVRLALLLFPSPSSSGARGPHHPSQCSGGHPSSAWRGRLSPSVWGGRGVRVHDMCTDR